MGSGSNPNCHAGHRARLRRRALEHGVDSLAEHEVLELILCFSAAQKDMNPIAHALIDKYGSLANVLEADYHDLQTVKGIGETSAALISLLPQVLGRYARERWSDKQVFYTVADLKPYVRDMFIGHTVESFYLLFMNAKNQIINTTCLGSGTADSVVVYPALVVEKALRHTSRSVVLVHNHPGGIARPSEADIELTEKCLEALNSIGVHVLDHMIAAGPNCYSMKESGILDQLKSNKKLPVLEF
jgi:DNA repair protein RadC